jgi:hypothetical protein
MRVRIASNHRPTSPKDPWFRLTASIMPVSAPAPANDVGVRGGRACGPGRERTDCSGGGRVGKHRVVGITAATLSSPAVTSAHVILAHLAAVFMTPSASVARRKVFIVLSRLWNVALTVAPARASLDFSQRVGASGL